MNKQFLPVDLVINSKEDLLPFYQELIDRQIESPEDLGAFLKDVSDLESAVSEDMAWRYIRMTCDTQNKEHEQAYLNFVQEIQPHLAPLEDQLNNKIAQCEFAADLELDAESYHIYFRGIKGATEIYRQENIPIFTEIQTLAQEYAAIQGGLNVEWEGKTLTLQQASNLLLNTDRTIREQAWKLISDARLAVADKLETLFSKMVQLRHQVAVNAGFDNYRDYTFKSLGRYDYTANDCKEFHQSVEAAVVPLMRDLMAMRKDLMKLETIKPWDTAVDPTGRKPLKPFENGHDLLEKGLACLGTLRPFFRECLDTMKTHNLLDLDSRLGKAPGGYNYPLAKTNMPFIFMNASGNLRDVETLVHEAGHAIHSFLMAPLELNAFKNTPSEVAELASMSMELLSMTGWESFFSDKKELNRAKAEQLEGILGTLPWIAQVDAFQHWIYENPNHTVDERKAYWQTLNKRFGTGMVDYTGLEHVAESSWHKQLHIFELPFYYIEYGIAQLGSIGIWKNYLENPEKALDQYQDFMKLGYKVSIPKIYETAGVKFDFSSEYITELMKLVQWEWSQSMDQQ